MTVRLTADEILAMVPEPEPEPVIFLLRLTPQSLAALMQTRWIPEDNPEYRVKVKGIVTGEDGWSNLIIVGESA